MQHEYLTVTALNQYINQKFERDPYLKRVYLTGEISNWRKRPGHQYFSVKDDQSVISAVMWKGQFAKIKFTPEEGMKVLITGRISTFPRSGQYQIYVEGMEPDGVGNLYIAYEQLKQKLYQAGLFDPEHKQVIPRYPQRIAVITSQSGAVIRDIIDAVRKRDPKIQIVLFPAAVQGDKAAPEIVQQIERVNQIGGFDTLIIGRGGGSIEDLWPFNEESVAQAIYASQVPIISSVGHQTDNTIADFVADIRASTPTQAGVLASPVLSEVIAQLRTEQAALESNMNHILRLQQQRLDQLQQTYVFQQPQRLYETYVQQCDQLTERLQATMQQRLTQEQNRLNLATNNLRSHSPQTMIQSNQRELAYQTQNLRQAITQLVTEDRDRLANQVAALDHLSPLKIMSRGYSLVHDHQDQLVTTIDQVHPGEQVTIDFSDGTATADVTEVTKNKGVHDGKH
ncbi:exodeoxyribonuclease VII large subunit [Fructilactobacillus myrtifloralis]|uniref:Exodeoxyribonuclease 7 large subunit n=1 Tax=Fructilactobacillus myrtifloralis TaxID=2940301 RepID=A0ABY5BQF9_9LACO|nr:exodeoxyribonuclease VII large subunit [Fructilactobacillus myrtifloralis]USS85283.1 exodeoxyribonuclease VII large subunit [Fructilactobacillus myrtifloralis]